MNINSLFIKAIRASSQLINYQTIRWRKGKKPFWLGVAKSKMFVIPQPRVIRSPEDLSEFGKLKRNYDSQMKSLLNFIKNDDPLLKEVSETGMGEKENIRNISLQNQIAESLENNRMWNAESAKRRETRMKANLEETVIKAAQVIEDEEKINKERMEIIEEIVRKEKLLSENYITPENLDEAIENCLNKIESYDFAIDFQGNKYHGRKPLSSTSKPDTTKLSEIDGV